MQPHSCNRYVISQQKSLALLSPCSSYYLLKVAISRCEGQFSILLQCLTLLTYIYSVFSGKTNGLDPKTFPEFDPHAFDALQEAYVNFGNHVFSKSFTLAHPSYH